MKNEFGKLLSILMFAGVASLHAQAANANVPFDFHVGKTVMPKGTYRVAKLSNTNAIVLTGRTAVKATATGTIYGAKIDEPARLVFRCYSGACYLSEVWGGSGSIGNALPRMPVEKELASNHAPEAAVVSLVR